MQHRLLAKGLALAAGLLLAATTITPATAGPPTINRGSYAALGDSYAAGVGNETLLPGAAKSGRTAEAYPVLLAGQWNRVAFLASSGATIDEVLMKQVPKVPESVEQITLTVGGNDVGFGQIALKCAEDPASTACVSAVAGAPGAAEDLPADLAGLLVALRAKAPNATIYVTGYPLLFQPQILSLVPYTPYCAAIPTLSGVAAQADLAIGAVNMAMQAGIAAAGDTNIVYVDVTVPFTGAGLCVLPPAGLIFAPEWDENGQPLPKSLHPTALGQQAYADAIEGAGFVTG